MKLEARFIISIKKISEIPENSFGLRKSSEKFYRILYNFIGPQIAAPLKFLR